MGVSTATTGASKRDVTVGLGVGFGLLIEGTVVVVVVAVLLLFFFLLFFFFFEFCC